MNNEITAQTFITTVTDTLNSGTSVFPNATPTMAIQNMMSAFGTFIGNQIFNIYNLYTYATNTPMDIVNGGSSYVFIKFLPGLLHYLMGQDVYGGLLDGNTIYNLGDYRGSQSGRVTGSSTQNTTNPIPLDSLSNAIELGTDGGVSTNNNFNNPNVNMNDVGVDSSGETGYDGKPLDIMKFLSEGDWKGGEEMLNESDRYFRQFRTMYVGVGSFNTGWFG